MIRHLFILFFFFNSCDYVLSQDSYCILKTSGQIGNPICLKITYNNNRISKAQIEDSYSLVFRFKRYPLLPFRLRPDDTANILKARKRLERDYRKTLKYLNKLELLPGSFWDTVRQEHIRYVNEEYKIYKIELNGLQNFEAFKKYSIEDCIKNVEILNNSDSVIFNYYAEVIANNHYSDDRINYNNACKSPHKYGFAKLYILENWEHCMKRRIIPMQWSSDLSEVISKAVIKVEKVTCTQ